MYAYLFKGARTGRPGAGGVRGMARGRMRDRLKKPIGKDNPMTKEYAAKRLAELENKGFAVRVTPEQWMSATHGQLDPVEAVQAIWSKKSYDSGLIKRASIEEDNETGGVIVAGAGMVHGAKANYVSRMFHMDSKTVDHSYLQLDSADQGGGAVKRMFAEAVPLYQRAGFEGINVHANLDAGGYSWAKYGFRPDEPRAFTSDFEAGWGKITKARSDTAKEYRSKLSDEAASELSAVREAVNKFRDSPDIGRVLTSLKTPALDRELSAEYETATSGNMPAKVKKTFVKVALYNSNWYGRLDMTHEPSMESLKQYLTP